MIEVHRLNGERFLLNSDMIETIVLSFRICYDCLHQFLNIPKTCNQIYQRGFSRTGQTDNRCRGSLWNRERYMVDHFFISVGETHKVVNSQVADEFLTIKGVKVSFVAGRNECGKTLC